MKRWEGTQNLRRGFQAPDGTKDKENPMPQNAAGPKKKKKNRIGANAGKGNCRLYEAPKVEKRQQNTLDRGGTMRAIS